MIFSMDLLNALRIFLNTSLRSAHPRVGCAHKWSDLSEHSFSVALLSDYKYKLLVLLAMKCALPFRAPKNPDDVADIGEHEFSWHAIMPHVGSWQHAGVVAEAYKFNVPISWAKSSMPLAVRSFLSSTITPESLKQ